MWNQTLQECKTSQFLNALVGHSHEHLKVHGFDLGLDFSLGLGWYCASLSQCQCRKCVCWKWSLLNEWENTDWLILCKFTGQKLFTQTCGIFQVCWSNCSGLVNIASSQGHEQLKRWIFRGGSLSLHPLKKAFVFLSRVHCGGLEVGGGGSHWLMGGQSAHRQLLPYSPTPSYIPHCTTDNSFYRSSK